MIAKSRSKSIAERRPFCRRTALIVLAIGAGTCGVAPASAQTRQPQPPLPVQGAPAPKSALSPSVPAGTAVAVVPPGYLIGPDDVLSIIFWRDKDMSADVSVRPDGKISLPLINDVEAAGLTPTELRDRLTQESKRYVEDASVTVVVKQINSRKVFVLGEVGKPGPYLLGGPTSVLQFIAIAGGLKDYAKGNKIALMRTENGKAVRYKFNYDEVVAGKKLQQNIELKPGDTIVVP